MTSGRQQAGQSWLAAAMYVALAGAVQAAPTRNGKATCATCHRAEAQSQPKTAMGIGMELPPDQEPLQEHPKLTMAANGYRYNIERKNGISTYTVSDGSGALTLPIRYAFGVHNLTFVLEYQGHFYESLATYYQKPAALGITMGDEKIRPHNLTEAMGRLTPDQEITACFNCHGTGGVSQGKLTLGSLKPGLGRWPPKRCRTFAASVIARGNPWSGCVCLARRMSGFSRTAWPTASASWETTSGYAARLATIRTWIWFARTPVTTGLVFRVIA